MAANPRPAARKAAARPQSRRPVEEPEVTAAEAQEIEAENYVTATLCGDDVQIIPPSAWRISWQRLLNAGNLDAFAQKVFHPDDYELYLEMDPTIVEFLEFTQDAAEQSGESLGKSRGPAPSSRRTRRR
ncbi:hypothetical protein [Streptomyces rishiriensis]|uniref:hypothetical protein n=1 Tax=Streptomyces rishiriensis TaxID=68264 RepID=UPI000D5918C7|nr:hypothetical protein [Streptomyces rishiriensis]